VLLSVCRHYDVDANPDGVCILNTYQFGSLNGALESYRYAITGIKWVGLFSGDVIRDGRLFPYSNRDRVLMESNIRRSETTGGMMHPLFASEELDSTTASFLQNTLENGKKADIEDYGDTTLVLIEVIRKRMREGVYYT